MGKAQLCGRRDSGSIGLDRGKSAGSCISSDRSGRINGSLRPFLDSTHKISSSAVCNGLCLETEKLPDYENCATSMLVASFWGGADRSVAHIC